ncbi:MULTISPECIES: sigma-70 family RNA polymerase sigma factor [Pseudomonas]|uniref:Sigma-70 family RNA polymerase sigma factor n=1 Tax=Pseudomonas donghuensis TaxID=1163398 RepID=A0AAP0X8Q2_9PSED|nr:MULTISPECIES: sigma-70 family RNA polymerase sigma factor [Pseudomonas]MDF9895459.1 RNA polymerase sigma-70 factor (ECF subfamily) [Pseudomonas vranovensis]KDN97333.1 sigma-70 family RNA polymerase sigma factor [Pseudomonas donghuensis]MBF4208718.1 sigma-70 family RNA polymerase sigma factor [Pseudomonas donghuensis]MBS7597911.1 sigma-70 family RNA polymerase sigma factor [Pseudomonas sp. RC2C2]MCP6692717.1 sigma-70 family RNA polymerase sigma factor [Pseudomonas donghuensis]
MPAPDHAALHALYSEHNGWLKNWLRARLGNASDAADLAQDTFIRVLNARNADTIREPRSYLGAIAHALMIDKFRRKALEQAYLDALALRPERVAESPESRLLILETLLAVDQMLDGLGERTRTIFLTVQLEGLSYVATAERLGVSVTTVKKHLIRAMTHCLLLTDD